MYPIAALLAAEHLNDLLREADSERRAALVRSARPSSSNRSGGLGGRISAALGRGRAARPAQTGPAGA